MFFFTVQYFSKRGMKINKAHKKQSIIEIKYAEHEMHIIVNGLAGKEKRDREKKQANISWIFIICEILAETDESI